MDLVMMHRWVCEDALSARRRLAHPVQKYTRQLCDEPLP